MQQAHLAVTINKHITLVESSEKLSSILSQTDARAQRSTRSLSGWSGPHSLDRSAKLAFLVAETSGEV